jgi:hypothetical protein
VVGCVNQVLATLTNGRQARCEDASAEKLQSICSPPSVSNANGEQRRRGMRDQEAISRAIAGELQGMEKLEHEHYFMFLDRGTGSANPLDPPEMP